jgi:hydrogenase expression/formation protein HypC
MCIGIPKLVLESEGVEGEFAWVAMADGSQQERVNMMLIGPQEKGTWVLTSLGTAREVLTEDEAATINDALSALAESLDGTYDPSKHFADLTRH